MSAKQTPDNPNVRFENGYVDVRVKVGPGLSKKVIHSPELSKILHDGERIKSYKKYMMLFALLFFCDWKELGQKLKFYK